MASDSGYNAVRFVRRYALLLSLPFLLVSIVLSLTAPLLVRLLFGEQYAYTGVLLRVMAASPFLYAFAHCYCTYFMLAFGYDKQWSKLILWSAAINLVVLIPLLLLINPAMALAVTGIALDVFMVVSAYIFYRKHAGEAERRKTDELSVAPSA
jgi:O-antigen/teichoic acid export membrane protein